MENLNYGCTILDFADIRYTDKFQLILADSRYIIIFNFGFKQELMLELNKQ